MGGSLILDTEVTGLSMSPCRRVLALCTRAGSLYVFEENAEAGRKGEGGRGGGGWKMRGGWCDKRPTHELYEYRCVVILAADRGVVGGCCRDRFRWDAALGYNEMISGVVATVDLTSGLFLQRLCPHRAAVCRLLAARTALGDACVSADEDGAVILWLTVAAKGAAVGGGGGQSSLRVGVAGGAGEGSGGAWWLEKAGDIMVDGMEDMGVVGVGVGDAVEASHLVVAHGCGVSGFDLGTQEISGSGAGVVGDDSGAGGGIVGGWVGGGIATLEMVFAMLSIYSERCCAVGAYAEKGRSTPAHCSTETCGGLVTCGFDSLHGSAIIKIWKMQSHVTQSPGLLYTLTSALAPPAVPASAWGGRGRGGDGKGMGRKVLLAASCRSVLLTQVSFFSLWLSPPFLLLTQVSFCV